MGSYYQRGPHQWEASVRRKGYPVQRKTFESRDEAETWVVTVESKIKRGLYVDNSEAQKTTLRQALERYEREVTSQKRGASSEAFRIKAWLKNPLADASLANLRGSDFAAYRDKRLSKGLSGSTVTKELALVSHLFEIARKEWGFEALQNPLKAIRKPVSAPGRDRTFLEGEEALLLAACEPQERGADGKMGRGAGNHWLVSIVRLALETAMRQGELVALTWDNVDLKRQVAHLPLTKNGERRDVPLSRRATELLASLPRHPSGQVFPITANAIKIGFIRATKRAREEYERSCASAGIPTNPKMLVGLRFHDLRHIATTALATKLPNLVELSSVTGHKDLRMLKRYYHPRAEDLARKLG